MADNKILPSNTHALTVEKIRRNSLTFYLSSAYVGVQDKYNSSLYYTGLGYGGELAFRRNESQASHDIISGYHTDSLTNEISNRGMRSNRGSFQYTYLRNLDSSNWRIGGEFQSLLHVRRRAEGNNAFSYEVIHSIGFAAEYNWYPFIKKKLLPFHFKASLPILTYINRPSFSNTEPEKYLVDNRFNFLGTGIYKSMAWDGKIVPISVFTQINSSINTVYRFNINHSVSLKYSWSFYAFNDQKNHQVKVANHLLSFGYQIRF